MYCRLPRRINITLIGLVRSPDISPAAKSAYIPSNGTGEEFKGCKAEKTNVWFYQGGKYCRECLESMVMSEALQPERDEEQRELRDSIRRECDHVYSLYDE